MAEKNRATGVDLGTMFFQVAENGDKGEVKFKTVRNAFVEMAATDDIEETLKRNQWQYIKDGGHYYVIGEDSLQVSKMFPGKIDIRRPMQDGVLNKDEDKKMVVVAQMIESAIGKAPDQNSWVCTCVSSESVDGSADSAFHRARLEAMFKRLGWNVKTIEEAQAVILAERPVAKQTDGTEVPYTGLGLSFGAGRANCVLSYKGMTVVGMSCARSGDWIDKQVAEQTGVPLAQVVSAKEKRLDFDNIDMDDDVLFALDTYYERMLQYVFKNFAKKFAEVKSQFDYPLDIVVAGGTSMPKGFAKKMEGIVRNLDLPFKIREVRMAKSPRNAVVEGLLISAVVAQKKHKNESLDDILNT